MFFKFKAEKYKQGWMRTHFLSLLMFVFFAVMVFETYFLNIGKNVCWKEIIYRRVSIEFFSFYVLPIIFLILEITLLKFNKKTMLLFFATYSGLYLFWFVSGSLLYATAVMPFACYAVVVFLLFATAVVDYE